MQRCWIIDHHGVEAKVANMGHPRSVPEHFAMNTIWWRGFFGKRMTASTGAAQFLFLGEHVPCHNLVTHNFKNIRCPFASLFQMTV